MSSDRCDYTCPSASPDAPEARVLGVVLGDEREQRLAYLEEGVTLPRETIESLEGVSPTRVLRFAGKCAGSGCIQFQDGRCRLGRDILNSIEPVPQRIPDCSIRPTCRWFAENGPEICKRCSRVVTTVTHGEPELLEVASRIIPETAVTAKNAAR
jgi:hypothetical protein